MSGCGDDCARALDSLYLFLDSELDTANADEIQRHLDDCAGCLTEYDVERVVKALVSRSCHDQAPAPLRDKVLLSIRTVEIRVDRRP